MEKFIPYEKLSKKKRRALAATRRGSWGALNPVTRKPENPKAYNRKKARKWSDESPMTVPFDFIICYAHLGVTWKPFPWSGILIRHKKFDLCVESQCR